MTDVLPGRQSRTIRPGLPFLLPSPCGPVTEQLLVGFRRAPHELSPLPLTDDVDPITDDDRALALHLCYEVHYLGLPGVDEGWEWESSLLRERQRLEREFEAQLVRLAGQVPVGLSADEVDQTLQDMASAPNARSLSGYMAAHGTLQQLREFAIHRSAYQLKEADPHTWAIPRLSGRSKAALVEIQRGEYGDGVVEDVHANLFAEVLAALSLDHRYGAYVDRLPGITLSTGNLISYFGLHRRWRGALVGHLALFETCSVGPMSRYAAALRRLGISERAVRFYEEHVSADEHHGVVALDEMVRGLLEDEPTLGGEILFGARALDVVERLFADHLLDAWNHDRSSLRPASANRPNPPVRPEREGAGR